MARPRPPPPLLLLLLLGFLETASSIFEVKNSTGTTCILANFSADFSVNYSTKNGSKSEASFKLPSSAEVLNSSSCGQENGSNAVLVIGFEEGHSLTLNFTKNEEEYRVQQMSLALNLSDTNIFHDAQSNGTRQEESGTDIEAGLHRKYRCVSQNQVKMGNATVTFSDVTLQAYLSNNSFSKEETRCRQDRPSPTTKPTTSPAPTPPPRPETPSVHTYNITDANGTTCLLVSMGLQPNVTYEKKDSKMAVDVFNINPNKTLVKGNCTSPAVTLELQSENTTSLTFQFGMNETTTKFFLEGIHLRTALPPDAKEMWFDAANTSLKALQATVGNSYRCNTEESVRVTKDCSVNIFTVQAQAFRVEGGKFGPVEECQLDENNMLIPIAVGAALAGLVLIVLIAYLIGRKRSHAGYQTI
ncbi:lysosome-associated membrane glycoprotein 1 [Ornithorhynchus anatinus]|uniref:Lysosome-associated membrane glycoprotein 1 n=1 Tax=Ornithorhynchus anatinus TaxID=9258 RepID=F7G445_ORNAN|nr:lysosome-associated membrane glycoprotein 1 [Ornithorhynchus anatinus]